jgi:hypothetical protein
LMRDPRSTSASRRAAAADLVSLAKLAPEQDDNYEVSDIELARWVISVLEKGAEAAEEERKGEGE